MHMAMATNRRAISSFIYNKCAGNLTPSPNYPPTPKQTRGESELAKALFSVTGMTDSTCAVPVEKAINGLPGIHEAVVDVLSNRAQVLYYPSLINVSLFSTTLCFHDLMYMSLCFFLCFVHNMFPRKYN